MNKTVLFLAAALLAASAYAADVPAQNPVDEKIEKLVRESIPYCADSKIAFSDLRSEFPSYLKGRVVTVKSSRPLCEGQYVSVLSPAGKFYLGSPWFLDKDLGATLEERLKNFTWKYLQQNVTPIIESKINADGLQKVTLNQTTERGKIPLEGYIDPQGMVFFLGEFQPMEGDVRRARAKWLEPSLARYPAEGASKPEVTVVEFSDFQCPSCKYASGYLHPILSKYGDKVRYVRFDLPLMQAHPWAFSAAVAGHAIHRQKPEVFWQYKKAVYDNQDKLNAFTFDDWARSFAADHDLDMAKYDADVASPEVQKTILEGIGVAFSSGVRATPTYVVNGLQVDAGDGGKALETYVAELLKK